MSVGKHPRRPLRSSGPIERGTPMKRSAMRAGPRKALPKVNVARKGKRDAAYKSFMASAVWKRLRREALEAAGNRCEHTDGYWWDGPSMTGGTFRCDATEKLTVHHKTYARFGGDELPEDLTVLCRDCHNAEHAAGIRPRGLR